MKIVAVTIGVGGHHQQMAAWAAEKVRTYLGLETRIVDETHLGYALPNVPHPKNIWTLKFSLFDIYPDVDRIMYFDNDWRPVRAFDLEEYCPNINELYYVRDRVYNAQVRGVAQKYKINPDNYFNAGWFVAHRTHQPLFQKCKEVYHQLPETWGDQCVMNQVLENHVTLLPTKLNTLDFDYLPAKEILGFHNSVSRFVAAKQRQDYDWNTDYASIISITTEAPTVDRVLLENEINGFDKLGGTDKQSDHSYGPIYEELLKPYIAGKKGTLVEIGVKKGGSLLLWQKLCPQIKIIGVDSKIDTPDKIKKQLDATRVTTIQNNAYVAEALLRIEELAPQGIDVAIDDGSHAINDQKLFLKLYLPRLKPGGFAVIEDVIDPDKWPALEQEVPTGWHYQKINLRHIKQRADDVLFIVQRPDS